MSLDSNSSDAYNFLAAVLNFSGRPEEAIGFSKKAMRLDPNFPFYVMFELGNCYSLLRRYDEAIAAYQEAARRNPDFSPTHQQLAVAYMGLGREKEARAEAAEILRINPQFSLDVLRRWLPFKNEADLDRTISGLRRAGLK